MRPANRAALLASTALFSGMAQTDLDALVAATANRTYRKGQPIVRQGDPVHSLFVIADGLVKVVIASSEGDELILATLGPGEVFGELGVIDGGTASASVETVESTTVATLSRATLLDLLTTQRSVADTLLRSLGAMIRRLTDQAGDLVFLDLEARVAKLLLALVGSHGATTDAGVELVLRLTQAELGAMVGGSRQSVNQILHAFERRGYVERRGREVVVKDLAALRRRSNPASA